MLALLVGCNWNGGTDPNSCVFGNERNPGPGCTVPDTTDWSVPPLETACGGGCTDGEVTRFQAARQGTAMLVFHLITQGPPDRSGAQYYFVNLFDVGRTEREMFFVVTPTGGRVMLGDPRNGFEMRNVNFTYSFAADGLEVRIPTDALPFHGGSGATAGTGTATSYSEGVAYSSCWDPSVAIGCKLF